MAIRLDEVSKIYHRHTGRKLLTNHLRSWFTGAPMERFFALRNVSLRILPGECVAIVGSNGAGKSTLLSLIAGLSYPDQGTLEVNGRVAALLELGAGFHPDLTGAENIHLTAALLGLTEARTNQLFDEIVDFSGVGNFINEPLRTYSSGMMMRLAFSVSVMVDPDILILDEVFAVGDHEFQTKCREKVRAFKREGKTMLCVSHGSHVLLELCERAIWLDGGELMMDGACKDVVPFFEGRSLRQS